MVHEESYKRHRHTILRGFYQATRKLSYSLCSLQTSISCDQVLDDVQYHQMVIALHQPSPLLPDVPSSFITTLTRSASLSLSLFLHSASRKQINVHWINLFHVFTSCAILVYCFCEHQSRSDLTAIPQDQVTSMVGRCREVISLFCGVGPIVQRYQAMLDQLIHAFESQQRDQSESSGVLPSSSHPSVSPPDLVNDSAIFAFDGDGMFEGLVSEGRSSLASPSATYGVATLPLEPINLLSPTYWRVSGFDDS